MQLPKSTLQFIYHFVHQQWLKFAIIAGVSIIWGINDTLFPYFIKLIVNTLQHYQGTRTAVFGALSSVLLLLVLFWLGTECFLRLQGVIQVYTFPQFRANIRKEVFDYVQSHSQEFFANHFAGKIANKLANLPLSCQTIMESICFQFVTAITGAILVLIMMWLTKPIFAVILLLWLFFHFGITLIFLRYGNKLAAIHADAITVLNGNVVDVFTNIMSVCLFGRNRYEAKYLSHYQQDEINKAKKSMWLIEIMRVGLGLSGLFLIFGMVFTLVYGWVHGWVSLGDFTQVGMQSFWLLGWIWFVSYQLTVFIRELGTVSDALSIIRKSHDVLDIADASDIQIKHGEIQFVDVTFAYRAKHDVFKNFNVTIAPGKKIGLVGLSGSGKSTFVNLILRFYDPQQGRILIDGQDISQLTQISLRSQIAMIPQDPTLFHRSLMENIRYGRLDATDEEVMAAAKLAHCHEFVSKLETGYDTLVGERGIKLSGGQRQRIAIARAILKNAPIIILDEATSSLDSITEKLIQDGLQHLIHNKTTLVIAHRLSTLTHMDSILVFSNGKIIEQGSREALLQANGHFAMLWNTQTDGFLSDQMIEK